jgi:hypothetical protein
MAGGNNVCDVCHLEIPGVVGLTPPVVCGTCMGDARVGTFDEREQAADLWARLVTAWESADGADDQEQDEFVSAVASLVAEWQGFVEKKAG